MNVKINVQNFESLDEIERETYREIIDGRNVHDHLKGKPVEELKAISMSDRLPYAVMALSLTGDGNVGGIVRSALLHGAEKVWVFGRRKMDKRPAVGTFNYIDYEIVNGFEGDSFMFDLKKFNKIIEDNQYYPIFIEQGGTSLEKFDWAIPSGFKMLLVVGNETNGVPDKFLEAYKDFSKVVSIPQRGVIRSFNVSNAMNIATWDMRVKKGWI